ncbi:hypothetical protein [Anaerocolumna sp. MB42-C2]|uniref:hypothetical protein n=1 Tax=Anaerocolumna sp. MB42-C2 TaxID=3070997 RepID=UPI0027E09739|nr:hypothetical protein [Anaerocolumna sp. MB42-C2]WMJ85963.1 hypothetical protein RBU59_18165 [Anaerocolumna sp. MB42-C2]
MGAMNNNPNNGNEFDANPITSNNEESADNNPMDSVSQSNDIETETITFEEAPYEQSYETTEVPSKKKPNPKFIAGILILIVLLAGSVTAYANRNTLANTIALMTKSPVEYYSSIEKKNINKGIDTFTESYDKYLTLYNDQKTKGVGQDTSVKLTVNPQFTGMIGLNDFKSLEAKITSMTKGDNSKSTIGFSYNEQALVTLNALINSKTGELFASVPELSSAYLLFSLNDLMSYSGEMADGGNYTDYVNDMEALLNNDSLSPDTLNSLLKKYSALLIDHIDNMKLEKNVKITASKSNATYNKLTAELNEEDIFNITTAILNEAKKDDSLKRLFATLNICKEDEYAKLIEDSLARLDKEAKTASSDPVLFNVYVDKTGRIMGREFTTSGKDKTSGGGYTVVSDGSKLSYTIWLKDNGSDLFDFSVDGTNSSSGFTGDGVLKFSGYSAEYSDYTNYSFNITAENAKLINGKGINGKYTISSDLFMGAEIVLDCNANDKQQNMKLQVMYGNMEAGALDITSKESAYEDFTFPGSSDQVIDNDIYSYMGTADFEGFMTHVQDVTGLDINSLLQSYLYGSY